MNPTCNVHIQKALSRSSQHPSKSLTWQEEEEINRYAFYQALSFCDRVVFDVGGNIEPLSTPWRQVFSNKPWIATIKTEKTIEATEENMDAIIDYARERAVTMMSFASLYELEIIESDSASDIAVFHFVIEICYSIRNKRTGKMEANVKEYEASHLYALPSKTSKKSHTVFENNVVLAESFQNVLGPVLCKKNDIECRQKLKRILNS